MKTKELRWLFIAVLGVTLYLGLHGKRVTYGISAEWSDGDYRYAGGTHPIALALSLLVAMPYLLLMYSPPTQPGPVLPGVVRRFFTFWLDFILAMILIAPIVGVLPSILEWTRTGNFEWSFERTVPARGDWLVALVCTVLISAGLIFYFAVPLLRRRPSPGACVTGYQILPDEGVPISPRSAIFRTLLGFVAVCTACMAPFVGRDRKRGKFWLDKVFGTRAVRLP